MDRKTIKKRLKKVKPSALYDLYDYINFLIYRDKTTCGLDKAIQEVERGEVYTLNNVKELDNIEKGHHCKVLFIDDDIAEDVYKTLGKEWKVKLNEYIRRGVNTHFN